MDLTQLTAKHESFIPAVEQGDTQAMFFDMKSLPRI